MLVEILVLLHVTYLTLHDIFKIHPCFFSMMSAAFFELVIRPGRRRERRGRERRKGGGKGKDKGGEEGRRKRRGERRGERGGGETFV